MKEEEGANAIHGLLDLNFRVIEGYYKMLFIMDAFTSLMVKKGVITPEELTEEINKISEEMRYKQEKELGVLDLDKLNNSFMFDKAFGKGKVGDA